MFTQGTVGEGDAAVKGYYGLRIGTTPANKSKAVTACSSMLITDTDPILWMNAAEIAFLRSEYELRWGSAVSAQNFYEQGIRLSFEERGVAGASPKHTPTLSALSKTTPHYRKAASRSNGKKMHSSKKTSNASSPRNGLRFSRSEMKRGRNTGARAIRN